MFLVSSIVVFLRLDEFAELPTKILNLPSSALYFISLPSDIHGYLAFDKTVKNMTSS